MVTVQTSPEVDLSSCANEPIHMPGSIQPHGVFLSVDQDSFVVLQVSDNTADYFGIEPNEILGKQLDFLFDQQAFTELQRAVEKEPASQRTGDDAGATPAVFRAKINGREFGASLSFWDRVWQLEFEPDPPGTTGGVYPLIAGLIGRLKVAASVENLAQAAAREVKRITGFGRVLVYRFDDDWNGHVIAEERDDTYTSYFDHWFPASDIPSQARKLYELNRVRLIADASYQPVPLIPEVNPKTGKPLDLSFAALRSVSPVHLEYLRNMGVASSMSISLLTNQGRLWGLIACHNASPLRVPLEVRSACDILAQILATQVEMAEQRAVYEQRLRLTSITTQLLRYMAEEEEFLDGLIKHPAELLSFADADGSAVIYQDRCTTVGNCPPEKLIWELVDGLVERGREEIYCTDCLPQVFPNLAPYKGVASGLLATSISKVHRSYVLWFRPEVVQTVTWGGDPNKPVETSSNGSSRLHPRKSFEAWQEVVRNQSLPWREADVEGARELRNAMIGVVLRKAEELAGLSAELQRSNKELEAFSYSVSHDLRAPFRHIVGYSELLKQSTADRFDSKERRYLDIIAHSAEFAGALVDNLLNFSQVGRAKLKPRVIDMKELVEDVRAELLPDSKGRKVVWTVGSLPRANVDPTMMKLVFQNLLHNALKYTRGREETTIEVTAEANEKETVFCVRDNGVGFEPAYADKLFGVFQRLHRMEDFEGTGIGLANVRRIVSRHGGRTWAEGEMNRGAAFFFTLPKEVTDAEHA